MHKNETLEVAVKMNYLLADKWKIRTGFYKETYDADAL